MGKVKVFLDKHSAEIIFITDFIAFIFSSIDYESINIGFLRKFVYGLNCIQFELLFILLLVMAFIVYRIVKYRFARSTTFTRIAFVCGLAFVLIESSESILNYYKSRRFYFSEKLYMSDFQAIPIQKGAEAFKECRYTEATKNFNEALALVDNSSYAHEINAYLKQIHDYKTLASFIFSVYENQPKTPERFVALLYCTKLDDDVRYKQAYEAAKQDILYCFNKYVKLHKACEKRQFQNCFYEISENGWCYFEDELLEDALKEKRVNLNLLIRDVLSETVTEGLKRLTRKWMINEEDVMNLGGDFSDNL